MPYEKVLKTTCANPDMSAMIHLCDRIDIAFHQGTSLDKVLHVPGMFQEAQVKAFQRLNQDGSLLKRLQNGTYRNDMEQFYRSIQFDESERKQYLEMLAYSIDFNSSFTVLHTIMTTSLAMELGKRFQLDEKTLEQLYYGSLLHDIGKGAIPISILEKRGALDEEEMHLMKTHVLITEAILDGSIDPLILHMAIRHHEKLDGSGYPYGLKAEELSLCDRIVAIADILSALLGKRSYKDEFPVSKAISILNRMGRDGLIDAQIIQVFIHDQDAMLKKVSEQTKKIKELYLSMQQDYIQIVATLPKPYHNEEKEAIACP